MPACCYSNATSYIPWFHTVNVYFVSCIIIIQQFMGYCTTHVCKHDMHEILELEQARTVLCDIV